LLYTLPDHDWSYCMWECGVATDAASPDTRAIVLQFSEDAPAPFEDQVRVNVRSKESLSQFVNQFLTDAEFFPGESGAITGYQAASTQVRSASEALFESLQKIPATRLEKIDEWPAWPFIRLQMSLDVAKEIAAADFGSARDRILTCSEIVHSDWVACSIFAVPKIASHTTLESLFSRWKEQFPSGDASWIDSLALQIHLASQEQFTKLEWKLLKSQRSRTDEWYSPVVAWVRKVPYRNSVEFDVYFLPFVGGEPEDFIRIALPSRNPASGT
jgi:hypothetical protein